MPKSAIELVHANLMRKRDIFLLATWGVPIAIFNILFYLKIPLFWIFLYMASIGAIFYIKTQDYEAQLDEIETFLLEKERKKEE